MIPNLFTGCITGIMYLFVLQFRNFQFREQGKKELLFAKVLAQLEKNKRQEKERFIAMLIHELKTPLSVLKLAYESGNATKAEKNVHGAFKDINDVIDRCALEDKLDNQGINLVIENHNLKKIIYQKVSEYESMDKFKLKIDGDLPIETDLSVMRIILGNLIDNAIKYGDKNSPIIVQAKSIQKDKKIYLSVTNKVSDVGLPNKQKIFTKYYRSEKAHKHTGSGLGLYLISNLLKYLKGQIQYSTNYKKDLITFEIILPKSM
jgi:signal transduction histidine kinase